MKIFFIHTHSIGAKAARLAIAITVFIASASASSDPLFDFDSIFEDSVEAVTLNVETEDGIIFEEIEFTSRVVEAGPERIRGILARPEHGEDLPAVFWSMGGMAPASKAFPREMAQRGYVCLAITLPHNLRNSFRVPFDTQSPSMANLTLLARDQMRGITLLSQRPEVDPERIAVGGASYGGVFATLLAGADPRVKAGFSFFGGGHHALGTNLPQFLKMETPEDVEIWNRMIDPAFRLRNKAIPFFWAVPVNDQWFHFPAVVQTFEEAAGQDKRIALIPHWRHGFTENIDRSLLDFLDTTPVGANRRAPYNLPGDITVSEENGRAVARFAWTGSNQVVSAELVVTFGERSPWLGWLHRACFTFPVEIDGNAAVAEFPIPPGGVPFLTWGNITDEHGVVLSTLPVEISRELSASLPITMNHSWNCFLDPNMGNEVLQFYNSIGSPLGGKPDASVKLSGQQSLRFDPAEAEKAEDGIFKVDLLHSVPGVPHRIDVAVRSESETSLKVEVLPIRPAAWNSKVVRFLVREDPHLSPLLANADSEPTPVTKVLRSGPEWEIGTLDIPAPDGPVEGYLLRIREVPQHTTTFWIDSLKMLPIWQPGGGMVQE